MKKALIVLAFSIVLVPAVIGQSMDVNLRQFQNQVICAPNTGRELRFINKYSPNNNYDFVGYMELNVYNCSSSVLDYKSTERVADRVVERKRRRF